MVSHLNNFRISVIIPTYKPSRYYLEECILSVRNQSLSIDMFEIILVLNGDISQIYQELITDLFGGYLGNVKILLIPEGGVSNARNKGLEQAKGEFICFIDDDDVISPNYLEELLKVSACNVIGVSNIHSFKDSIEEWNNHFFACKVVQRQKYPRSLFRNRAILSFPVAKLIHRSIIGSHLFDLRFANGEDALFMTQISDKISRFAFTESSACYFVRERMGSATHHRFNKGKLFIDTCLLLKEYIFTYLSAPFSYNFLLFLSRIPGVLKGCYILWKN